MRMEFHTSNNDKRYWTLTAIFYFNSQILKISALYYLYVIKWLRSICHRRDNIGLLAWLIMMIFWGKNSRYTFDSQSGYNEVHYHFWLCESYLFNVNLAYQLISIRVKSLNAFIVVAFIVVLLNAVFFVTAIQAILYFFFFSFPTLLFRVFSYYTLVTIDSFEKLILRNLKKISWKSSSKILFEYRSYFINKDSNRERLKTLESEEE